MHKERVVDLVVILGLFLLSFLFFGDVLFPEDDLILQGGDISGLFAPTMTFAFEAFENGRLPLWNPHLFLGFPQYAEPQLSTFYPFMWLFSGLGVATAVSWLYAIHFGLTAVGGYLLIRQLKGSWAGGLLTGIILAFSAFMVAHLYAGHLPHLMTIAYLPWLLAAVVWAVKPRSPLLMIAATLIAAVPLALAMLAGYAPFFPFLVTAVSLLMFWLAWTAPDWQTRRRIGLQWVLLGLFAGALTAVQLLPTAEFATLSSRSARADYSFASSFSIPFWSLLTVLMPDLYGAPVGDVIYWANYVINGYWEFAIYVGILPLILFVLVWPIGQKSWRFWVVVGLIGLLLALGPIGALHQVLFQLVPGFGLFRVPARMSYFFMLTVALLSGLMVDRWLDLPLPTFQIWQYRLRRLLAGGLILFSVFILFSVLWQAAQIDPELSGQVSGVTDQLVRFLILGAVSLALLLWGHGRPRWQVGLLLALFLLIDLWGHSRKLVALSEAEPELAWLMADLALPTDRATYRVMTDGLTRNVGSQLGFYHTSGYDDFRTETGLQLSLLASKDARIARLLSAQYLLLGPEQEPPNGVPGWQLLTEPAGVTIYERQDALPKAWVVHQVLPAADELEALRLIEQPQHDWAQTAVVQVLPDTNCQVEAGDPAAASVQLAAYEPERVILQTDTAVAGWLILNDLYYPGWQAAVDGEKTTIQPTDYGLRGICLPAGQHEVIFQFQPQILRIGGFISGAALILLVAAVLVFIIGSLRQRKINGRDAVILGK